MSQSTNGGGAMDGLKLSLEPKRKPEAQLKNSNLSLAEIIPRITSERGSFANLVEEDLIEEIEGSKNKMDIERDEVEGEDNDGDDAMKESHELDPTENNQESQDETKIDQVQEQKQNFDETRRSMVELVASALNESQLSLDFVSLLLSCLRPAAGGTSMSPLLKERVPTGSLASDALTVSIPEESPRVGAGWKLESLGKASSLLKTAAGRLKTEVEKEGTYWQSVFETVNAGEVLFKIRKGDARGLGIKYGFGDAGSDYRDRGVAIIKRGHDGSMNFKFDKFKRRHITRVTLFDNSSGEKACVGCSSYKDALVEENTVQDEIGNARRLIFEEELFYEIVREARRLAAYKVQVVGGMVRVNLQEHIIEIDQVDPVVEDEDEQEMEHSVKADLICNVLKILLCDAHRRNLQKRQRDPPPLNTKQPTPQRPLPILRPLIMHIHHGKLLKRTSRLLDMMLQDHTACQLDLQKYSGTVDPAGPSRLGKLLSEPVSTYTLSKGGLTVKIIVSTPIHPGKALFEVSAKKDDTLLSRTSLYELGELEEWTNWVLKKK